MATKNLGQVSAILISTTPPSNQKMLWYDDNIGQKLLKYYDTNTSSWKNFDGTGVYLPLSGGIVTGFITLHNDPTANLHPATKQYVDTQIANVADTLSGILAVGNTTNGNDIVITSGDKIVFSEGVGGALYSSNTTSARDWLLPDEDGTLVVGSGVINKVARWLSSGGLGSGVLLDNNATAGIGGLDASSSFYVDSSLEVGIRVVNSNTTSSSTGIRGEGRGVNVGTNIGGDFIASNGNINYGVKGVADGLGSSNTLYGGYFKAYNSEGIQIGVWGDIPNPSTTPTHSISILGTNSGKVDASKPNIGGAFILDPESNPFSINDIVSVHSAIYANTKGVYSGISYAGYLNNSATTGTNYGLVVTSSGGVNNYGIVVLSGKSGFGVISPSKMLEVQTNSSTGKITLDTSGVTLFYQLDIALTNSHARFSTTDSKGFEFYAAGQALMKLLPEGGVVVGSHSSVDSHLHVKYTGSFPQADGSIRGTQLDSTIYNYSSPTFPYSLVLENEDITANNSNTIVFRTKDTGGILRDASYIGTRYHTRSGSVVSGDIVFGVSNSGTLNEVMRLTSSGVINIGSETSYSGVDKVSKLFVKTNSTINEGIYTRQENLGISAGSFIGVGAKNSTSTYTDILLVATGDLATGVGSVGGVQKYFTTSGHIYTGDSYGHINFFARSENGSPLYDIRVFTGGEDYNESNLRLTIKSDGKFGFNLAKAGYTGSDVDNPLSDLHIGSGAYFDIPNSYGLVDHVIFNISNEVDKGGIILTSDPNFISSTLGVGGFKITVINTDSSFSYIDDELKIGLVDSTDPNTFINTHIYLKNNSTAIGGILVSSEVLSVNGVLSLISVNNPTSESNFGKIYISNSDKKLYYLDEFGSQFLLSREGISGSGSINEVAFFSGTDSIVSSSSLTWDGVDFRIGGNLIVTGTTTTIDSTVVTIKDPIFTIGDDVIDDNKDRGIEFKWNQGGSKVGFFGFDDSSGRFTFIPNATNTSEVFSGVVGDVQFGTAYLNGLNIATGSSTTYFIMSDVSGNGTWSSINNLALLATPNGSEDYVMVWDASEGVHKKVLTSAIGGAGSSHNLLDGTTHPDTVATSPQRGDIIVGNPSSKWDRLAKGTTNQYLKSNGTDILWSTIDITEIANSVRGSGTLNQIAYWSNSNTLTSSSKLLFDNSNLAIFGATLADSGVTIYSEVGITTKTTALRIDNNTNGVVPNYGLVVTSDNSGALDTTGIWVNVEGTGTATNTGIRVEATASSSGTNIAGKFESSNGGSGNHYPLQIIDGNQGVSGRFLKNITTSGHARWADITESDITDLGTYVVVGSYTDGYITRWNSSSNTLESSVLRDDGTQIGVGTSAVSGTAITIDSSYEQGISMNLIQSSTNPWGITTTVSGGTSTSGAIRGRSNGGGVSTVAIGLEGIGFTSTANYGGNTSIGVRGEVGNNTNNAGDITSFYGYSQSSHANNSYGIIVDVNNSGVGTSYIGKFNDNRTVGVDKFIKSIDVNGTAEWASIVASDISDISGTIVTSGGSSTDNAIVRWNGTGGSSTQNSGIIVSDTNSISGVGDLSISGKVVYVNDTNSYVEFDTNDIKLFSGTRQVFGNIISSIYSFNPQGVNLDFWIKDNSNQIIFESDASTSIVHIGPGSYSPGAHLCISSTTTTRAQINFGDNAVDKITPLSGDMWFNGTNLYFRKGGVTYDLLAPPGVSDGDKGDITVSGSGATWTVDNQSVTNSKLANVSTQTFKGRDTAGSGSPEDLSISTVKKMLAGPRVSFTTSTTSLTIDMDTTDEYEITALAAGLTINAPTGTLTRGRKLWIRLEDNGTARTITWNAVFRAIGVTLPTTTVATKVTHVGLRYDVTDSKWDCVAVKTEA